MNKLSKYKNLFFDCDGVILNSNKIKTEAFKEVVSNYGEKASTELQNYHIKNGGISRYKKFNYFLDKIAINHGIEVNSISVNKLVEDYSRIVKNKLLKCEVCSHIINYRKYSKAIWFIVSGSDQDELIEVFKQRKLNKFFDGGIYGSPLSKDEIFRNIFKEKMIEKSKSIYLGDSKYDYIAAKNIGIDFIFLSKWSEFREIKKFSNTNNIDLYKEFNDLI